MRRRRDQPMAQQGGHRHHVVLVLPNALRAGYPGPTGACGAVLHGPVQAARMVPEAQRCRTPACRALWPAHLHLVVA